MKPALEKGKRKGTDYTECRETGGGYRCVVQSAQVRKPGGSGVSPPGARVIPINRHESEIEGLRAFRSVLDVPGEIDMVTIYVPPADALDVLSEVAEKQIPEVWLDTGADAPEVIARARELAMEPIVACSLMATGAVPQGS